MNNKLFPVFLDLSCKRVLVVGGGGVACRKVGALLNTGAEIIVVCRDADPRLRILADKESIKLYKEDFHEQFLEGIWLVIAATDDAGVNLEIFKNAEKRKIFCNIVDVAELCSFHVPAVLRRGDLQIAVSSAGKSPLLAKDVKRQIASQFGPEYSRKLDVLNAVRQRIKVLFPEDFSLRKRLNELAFSDPELCHISLNDHSEIDNYILQLENK